MQPVGQKFELASGKLCHLTPIRNDLIPNYYLLAFPKDQGQPSSAEVTEMLNFGISHAQKLAGELLGDTEAFTILYSGYSVGKKDGTFTLCCWAIAGERLGCTRSWPGKI